MVMGLLDYCLSPIPSQNLKIYLIIFAEPVEYKIYCSTFRNHPEQVISRMVPSMKDTRATTTRCQHPRYGDAGNLNRSSRKSGPCPEYRTCFSLVFLENETKNTACPIEWCLMSKSISFECINFQFWMEYVQANRKNQIEIGPIMPSKLTLIKQRLVVF